MWLDLPAHSTRYTRFRRQHTVRNWSWASPKGSGQTEPALYSNERVRQGEQRGKPKSKDRGTKARRCFVCDKPGHIARDCPTTKKRAARAARAEEEQDEDKDETAEITLSAAATRRSPLCMNASCVLPFLRSLAHAAFCWSAMISYIANIKLSLRCKAPVWAAYRPWSRDSRMRSTGGCAQRVRTSSMRSSSFCSVAE